MGFMGSDLGSGVVVTREQRPGAVFEADRDRDGFKV